jgi:hypothetical protein
VVGSGGDGHAVTLGAATPGAGTAGAGAPGAATSRGRLLNRRRTCWAPPPSAAAAP